MASTLALEATRRALDGAIARGMAVLSRSDFTYSASDYDAAGIGAPSAGVLRA